MNAAPPATKKVTVTDTYHGEKVIDDYRWLEDGKNKDVQEWSEAQNAAARAILDAELVCVRERTAQKRFEAIGSHEPIVLTATYP